MYSNHGHVEWIGIRPGRKQDLVSVSSAALIENSGIEGDHYEKTGKRQVTLIQAEHLDELFDSLKMERNPGLIRRNIVVRGIELQSLKNKAFKIGDCVLEGTGDCLPCERMNENLGPGGQNAMAGKGGITAKIINGGKVTLEAIVTIAE